MVLQNPDGISDEILLYLMLSPPEQVQAMNTAVIKKILIERLHPPDHHGQPAV